MGGYKDDKLENEVKKQTQEQQKQEEYIEDKRFDSEDQSEQISDDTKKGGIRNLKFPVQGYADAVAYLSKINENSKFGIILIGDMFGLNKHICDYADKLAGYGYQVLALDIYRANCPLSVKGAVKRAQNFKITNAIKDVKTAVAYLKEVRGCESVGAYGHHLGAQILMSACTSTDQIEAGVFYYGFANQNEFAVNNIRFPILCHIGSHSKAVGISDLENAQKIENHLIYNKKDFTLKTYQCNQYFDDISRPLWFNIDASCNAFVESITFLADKLQKLNEQELEQIKNQVNDDVRDLRKNYQEQEEKNQAKEEKRQQKEEEQKDQQ